jgi:hypothetical protein
MANYFDQFDSPQSEAPNFFDQFDTPTKGAGESMPPIPHAGKVTVRDPKNPGQWMEVDDESMPLIPYKPEHFKKWAGFLAGTGQGAADPAIGVAQLATHAAAATGYEPAQRAAEWTDRQVAAENAAYEQARKWSGLAGAEEENLPDINRGFGNIVSPVTYATGVAGMAGKSASALSRLSRAMGTGAAIAAEQPIVNPKDYWTEKGEKTALGAVTGLGVEAGAGIAAPWVTGQARKLAERYNIRVPFLTGLGNLGHRAEQISQSVPLSGMAVRGQYEQANEDLVRAAYNEAVNPIRSYGFGGDRYLPKSAIQPGREMASHAAESISNSYDDVLPRLTASLDTDFKNEVARIRANLPERTRADFDDAMQRNVYNYAALKPQGGAPQTQIVGAPTGAVPQAAGTKAASTGLTGVKTGPVPAAGPAQTPQGPTSIRPSKRKGYYDVYQGDQKVGALKATGVVARVPLPGEAETEAEAESRIQSVVLGFEKTQPEANPNLYQPHIDNLQKAGTDLSEFSSALSKISTNRALKRADIAQIYESYTGQGAGRLSKGQMVQGIQNQFAGTATGLPHLLTGENVKFADMGLRDEARQLMQSPGNDLYNRKVGEALAEVRQTLRDTFKRDSAARDVAQLSATDLAYRRNMILNRASTSSAAPEGVFGPTQLFTAVKAGDPTLGKRAMAQGTAELQDLADTAKSVLGKTVADSGTPERGAMMWGIHEMLPAIAGGTAVASAGTSTLAPVAAGLAAHGLAYTNPGQAALRALSQGAYETRTGLAGTLRTVSPQLQAAIAAGLHQAREAPDGEIYIPDAGRPGKLLKVQPNAGGKTAPPTKIPPRAKPPSRSMDWQ